MLKYGFTQDNLDAIKTLSSLENYNMAIKHNPLKQVMQKKIMPEYLPSSDISEIYTFIKEYATLNNYTNTLKALSVASKLHEGQFRKGGAPYIIHPLYITLKIIYSATDDDITCAAALLHDVIEDNDQMNKCNGERL